MDWIKSRLTKGHQRYTPYLNTLEIQKNINLNPQYRRFSVDETAFISKKIQKLKMPGMLNTMEQRLKTASAEKWSYSTFLDAMLSDELDQRNNKQLTRRLAKSYFPPEKTLESFDISFNRLLA
jgi:hypothetical protein